jgi:hypothetical protein
MKLAIKATLSSGFTGHKYRQEKMITSRIDFSTLLVPKIRIFGINRVSSKICSTTDVPTFIYRNMKRSETVSKYADEL